MSKVDVQEIVKETLVVLKEQGLIKTSRYTPFQKTEQLLYNYKAFKQVIIDKQEYIDFIKEGGLQERSKDILRFSKIQQGMSEMTKEEEVIRSLENSIALTKKYIAIIDAELVKISSDPYFDLIRLRYFEGKSREEIAEYFEVDVSTVTRNKNRLINTLKVPLFSDEVIAELFC